MLDVPLWVWAVTLLGLVVLLAVDLVVVDHRPHAVTVREAAGWTLGYVALAVAFGVGVFAVAGGRAAGEFAAGYLTEYSLSVDNLFVFVLLLTSFAVPAVHQHRVLLFGIVLALVLRGVFIAVGAALLQRFVAVFYVFGAVLLVTAVQLVRHRDREPHPERNPLLRAFRRVVPTTTAYDGAKVVTRVDGRLVATPLLVVMIAVGSTDVLFAVDSIPAIFGLTRDPYLVFTANMFALMGLRSLYFLLDGLLDRLVYLSHGLAAILAFIGAKLVVEALHEQVGPPFPEIPILVSLGVILGTLGVTTVLSLARVRRDPADRPAVLPAAGPPVG